MGKEYHVVINVSTATATFEKANTILSLAQIHPEVAETLAACAALMLGAALEQGVQSILKYVAECAAMEDDIEVSTTQAAKMCYPPYSAWYRVQRLPELFTGGQFRLKDKRKSPIVNHLYELIQKRNELVHIDDSGVHLVGPSREVVVEEKEVRVTTFIPLPKNPWNTVSIEDAQNFLTAVRAYFSEILFPEKGHKAGVILAPVS